MSKAFMYVVQELMNQKWVTLANIGCSDRAMAHLQELQAVAPEPPGGGRYRVIRKSSADCATEVRSLHRRTS